MIKTVILIAPFVLIFAGVMLLIKGIRLLKRFFSTAIIADTPFQQLPAEFSVPKDGEYSIWQAGYSISKVPVFMPPVSIYQAASGEALPVRRTAGNVYINLGAKSRVQVLMFWAATGQYTLAFTEAFPATPKSKRFDIFSRRQFDPSKYSLQIREKQPAWLVFIGTLWLVLSAASIVSGIVFIANPALLLYTH